MIANVTLFTLIICLVILFLLLDNLSFLAPYRSVALQQYRNVIIGYFTFLFFNVFGILFMVYRKFFLKDTGRKLKHLEKQLETEDHVLLTELERRGERR